MAKISGNKKQQRKETLLSILQRAHPHGMRTKELADEIGTVSRRTIDTYLDELETEGHVYKGDGVEWFAIRPPGIRLPSLNLSPEEAMTLYLAARLLTKQEDKLNEIAIAALYKLADVLSRGTDVSTEIVQAAQEMAQRTAEKTYEPIFRRMMQGYIYRKPMRITYEPSNGTRFETVFHTYLMEPSAVGHATYAIGHSSLVNDIRSYKLERIQSAEFVGRETYTIPDDFSGLEMLRNAWSIFMGDETVRVVLHFSPAVADRVLETNWHPSQETERLADGRLRWQVDVAGTTDLTPWIRGWGADVEVMEPAALREEIKGDVRRNAARYHLSTTSVSPRRKLVRLWGKTTARAEQFHPALYHMIDVGMIAHHLLSHRASPRWRQVLARALNMPADRVHEWLPWIVALHDIGKLTPAFQAQNEDQLARLKEEDVDFGEYEPSKHLHHTIAGHIVLKEWAREKWPRLRQWQRTFLDMVAGHHGVYQRPESTDRQKWNASREPAVWTAWRKTAIDTLSHIFLTAEPDEWPQPDNLSAAIAALNGFTILCDWLGSDGKYFTPRPEAGLLTYVAHSRAQAQKRVAEAGFFVPVRSRTMPTYASLYPGWHPRPIQTAVEQIPLEFLVAPSLTIIEAPTGEGKTEAALTLARRIAHERGTDEMYIALPTTATSNAMYTRICEHLLDRLGLTDDLLQLIHGQAMLMRDDLHTEQLSNGRESMAPDKTTNEHPVYRWFTPKKRALLAPFGVGTVDQAELAALHTRHNALRMIGLAGKTIILDEIHAYDTYMSTIIADMLAWLAELGASVILLSATLPAARKRHLLAAYAGEKTDVSAVDTAAYPSLLTATAGRIHTATPPAAQAARRIALHALHYEDEDTAAKADWLLKQVNDGGCACWITNTVARAQQLYTAVAAQAASAETEIDLILLHGRLPLDDRRQIEEAVLDRYGKEENGRRPPRGIVIGTQVLEQSLDLDFDVMATDLAPVDLVLQRAGRLHRHPQRTNRHSAHPQPRLYVNTAVDEDGRAAVTADRFYTLYLMQLSWRVLRDRIETAGHLTLPADYRPLIEAVYTEEPPAADDRLRDAWDEYHADDDKLRDAAKLRLSGRPNPRQAFWRGSDHVFDEEEGSNAWRTAQTRYQERESITVVPVARVDEKTAELVPLDETVPTHKPADRETQLRLLRRGVSISHPAVVAAVKKTAAEQPVRLFTDSALLKYVYPLWLTDDRLQLEKYTVYLDPALGLVIEKGEIT